jgi:hypothetical protein
MKNDTGGSFASDIVESHRPHLRLQLEARGTWLDDISVLQLFYHMAVGKKYTRAHATLIDSCFLETALYGRDDKLAKNQALLRREMRESADTVPLILIPLVGCGHWSLLCYRTRAHHWYHLDSLPPLHTQLARATVNHLERIGAVPRKTVPVDRLPVPQQRASWECGLYTLQYMIHALECTVRLLGEGKKSSNEKQFRKELLLYSELACEKNLLLFTQSLLAIV